MQTSKEELERIMKVYKNRERKELLNLYTYFNRGNLFIIQDREKKLLDLLDKYGMNPLDNKKIFDIGCGSGGWLRDLLQYGAKPENLYGIELLHDRFEKANYLCPNMNITQGNAVKIEYDDEMFDIVLQSTVFTSIMDYEIKKRIAIEMLRVLSKDGIILWYDFRYNNPNNPDVSGIKKREIKELFPECDYEFKTVTLLPPLVRKLAKISWLTCFLLNMITFLRTHYFAVIRKRNYVNEDRE
ncbi:MAG: class I SAM-dependent methyltransferase [Deltaproteobacteria bacterium]|nr:MAG: class I SAM-dependent methyltransferase [Deltaproteobacteria bacterium]